VGENFARLFESAAQRWADACALVWDGGRVSYRRLDRQANAVAAFLARHGVVPGDRVALAIANRWPFVPALLGVLKLGATVAPLDPLLSDAERQRILDDLAPRVVIHDVLGDEMDWDTRDDPPAPALVLYTSGSTGTPKGAMLSHGALQVAVESWAGPVMGLRPGDVVLAVLPLSHSFGLNGALLAPLISGASVVLVERFAPETVLTVVRDQGVTVFPGVATMFRRLLDAPAMATADLGPLRLCVSGAAPCPWPLARDWRGRTGVRILRGYGMTELFRPISYLADDPAELPESIGRAVPGVELRVVDGDGRALEPGEVGELWIRTPAAMDGYLGSPEETRAVLADGWFRTGDLAALSPDGYVTVAGRQRERILRGGYSVFPGEVEAVLLAHPAVAEAAVVGEPHAELGEEVVAFVALRDGAGAAPETLVAWCKERLAGFKYPRTVTVLDRLPRGATGKIVKSRLLPERHS
jgi:long-chain acyl-CoA synthetase